MHDGVDPVIAELVKIRASQINGCGFCIDMHVTAALAAGESPRRLHTLPAWAEVSFYTERERAALALTEAVTLVSETHIPDDVWHKAEQHFTPSELAHLLLLIATINAFNRIAISSRAQPPNIC